MCKNILCLYNVLIWYMLWFLWSWWINIIIPWLSNQHFLVNCQVMHFQLKLNVKVKYWKRVPNNQKKISECVRKEINIYRSNNCDWFLHVLYNTECQNYQKKNKIYGNCEPIFLNFGRGRGGELKDTKNIIVKD